MQFSIFIVHIQTTHKNVDPRRDIDGYYSSFICLEIAGFQKIAPLLTHVLWFGIVGDAYDSVTVPRIDGTKCQKV